MEEGISDKALKSLEDTECGWGGRGGGSNKLWTLQSSRLLQAPGRCILWISLEGFLELAEDRSRGF